jgi:hypothetical protein
MNLPVAPGEKYTLIALDSATTIKQPVDLHDDFFALPHGSVTVPDYWKEWIGSIDARQVESAGLVILAKAPARAPDVLDDETQVLEHRVGALYWALLDVGHLRFEGTGAQLSGANVGGKLEVKRHGPTQVIQRMPGMWTLPVTEDHLRRATALAVSLLELFRRPGMRRLKRAVSTFMNGFEHHDVGDRVHQFVRVVGDGFTRESGREQFRTNARLFVSTEQAAEACSQLYRMRNNAEHFNEPDTNVEPPLSPRESFVRAMKRAHEVEAVARYCLSRFLERRQLWSYWDSDEGVSAFWGLAQEQRRALWGAPLVLEEAVAGFDPQLVRDERS